MEASAWLNAFGWFSSALVIFSLMQARVLRFRIINSIACILLAVFNAILGVWPMVAMNAVLVSINVYFIRKLTSERHSAAAFEVLDVSRDDPYTRRFLEVHAEDIRHFFPAFDVGAPSEGPTFLVLHGDQTAGVVIVRSLGDGSAHVDVDYVTAKYRDFTTGEFVYRRSGAFSRHGITRLRAGTTESNSYFEHMGFTRDAEGYVLDLA